MPGWLRGFLHSPGGVSGSARVPNPERLVQAYHQSASTLNLLRAFTKGGFAALDPATTQSSANGLLEFAGFAPAEAYDKNLTYRAGRCPARAYIDRLLPIVREEQKSKTISLSSKASKDSRAFSGELRCSSTKQTNTWSKDWAWNGASSKSA